MYVIDGEQSPVLTVGNSYSYNGRSELTPSKLGQETYKKVSKAKERRTSSVSNNLLVWSDMFIK